MSAIRWGFGFYTTMIVPTVTSSNQLEELARHPQTAQEMKEDYAGESTALGQQDPFAMPAMGGMMNIHESPATEKFEELEREGYKGD
ncbi:MAG TPA: hypothetical protein VG815_02990 [Chloroflexota bacterium]|jgi:hypothetical protein|nr:hypothetical protein [Chloroflexota bacterium]